MEKGRVSASILLGITRNCKDDLAMAQFIRELCFIEAKYPGKWNWRKIYEKKLDEYVKNWDGSHED